METKSYSKKNTYKKENSFAAWAKLLEDQDLHLILWLLGLIRPIVS